MASAEQPPKPKLTPDEFLHRCRSDERFFIESTLSIVDRDTNAVKPFRFNHAQNYYETVRSPFDMILKARKEGFSSRKIAGDLHACIFNKNERAVLLNFDKSSTVMMLEDRVKPILRSCKFPFRCEPRRDFIWFPETKSRYYVGTAGTLRFGRGSDITRYHLTEVAHYSDPGAITAIEEACVGNAQGSMETTANGQNFFYQMWRLAVQGKSRYKPIFIPWWLDPGYQIPGSNLKDEYTDEENKLREAFKLTDNQLAWRRKKAKEMSRPELLPQEYPASADEAFLSSGRMVFDWVSLMRHQAFCKNPSWTGALRDTGEAVEFFPQAEGRLFIWHQPISSHKYVIGADVAEGIKGGAYSVAFVLDANTAEQVAEWHGHVPPDRFADVLVNLGYYYGTALLAPESWPGPGATTTVKILDYRYKNIWQRPARGHRTNPEQLYGWETDRRTRPQMIHGLVAAMRDYRLRVYSAGLIDEMRGVIYDDDGDIAVNGGCYVDRVFACAIAWAVAGLVAEGTHAGTQKFREMERGMSGSGAVSVPKWNGRPYR